MIKKIFAFSLFDFGETIFGALVYSTFFPLYISQHIDPKIYGVVYGMTFLISFLFALQLGKIADEKAKRKHFFIYFVILTAIFCLSLGFTTSLPIISLIIFSLMSISHQQSFVFYNFYF
jgi:UMF1 family MFS transporter